MELRPHIRLVLLCMGIILGNILQIIAQEVSCNENEYLNEKLKRCCKRCPPGHYLTEKCTSTSDTVCSACEEGTYAANWNSAINCRTCYPCSQSLVQNKPCTPTKNTVCGCPEGQYCTLHNAMEECLICAPLSPTSPTPNTDLLPSKPPPDLSITWIIVGVGLFLVVITIVIVSLKTSLLKSFGRMIKDKRPSESIPQVESPVTVDLEPGVTVYGGPATRLLTNGEIKTPLQETALSFPIQVTDDTDIGEFALSK